jgi:hypothetical protein
MKFSAKNPRLRKAANRWQQAFQTNPEVQTNRQIWNILTGRYLQKELQLNLQFRFRGFLIRDVKPRK